jgi:hypothetical protein
MINRPNFPILFGVWKQNRLAHDMFCNIIVSTRHGQAHTKEFMEKKCKIFVLPPAADSRATQPPMFPDIAQYISKVQTENQGGQVFPGL